MIIGGQKMEYIFRLFIRNKIPLLVFISGIFVIGVVFGAFAIESVNFTVRQDLFEYFNDFLQEYEDIEFEKSNLISESTRFNLLVILFIWIFGASVVVMPLVPVLVFFKGFVLGFTIGFLISKFEFQGILLAVATVFPQNLLIVPAYILAGLTAVDFSFRIIKHYRGKLNLTFGDFFDYTSKIIFLGFILMAASLIESFLIPHVFRLIIYLTG